MGSAYGVAMRITSDMNNRMMSSALRQHQASIYNYQQQIASGLQVRKPSDDPGGYGLIRNLKSDLSKLQQYSRNVDMALGYHKTVNQGITQAVNIMHRINELAVSGGDATLDSVLRESIAEEINSMLEAMIGAANSSEGGRHVFAGLRTDVPPYEAVHDAEGQIIAVQYVGSTETRNIKTGDELYVATNLPGSTDTSEGGVFQTATRDIFDSIIQLRDALAAGDEFVGTDIQTRLQGDLDHVLNQASLNGVREEQVRMHKTYLLEMQQVNQASTEPLESVDVASAMIKLSQSETAYQAALSSTSRMLQQVSLLNFI
jgi:flagellar hook-associated protein 3 FlgL